MSHSTIYMFHSIGDIDEADWADAHYSYSTEQYLDFLNKVGSVTSLKDSIADKSRAKVILTFDDGHISNYEAAKILFKGNYGTADFFINPEKVGSPYYMSWEQLAELVEWGMSIQSHGLDHSYLSDCSDQELQRQLEESKKILEAKLDIKVTILAPPGGRFDGRAIQYAKKLGYNVIANSIPGHMANVSAFTQPRMAVLKHYTVVQLLNLQAKFKWITVKQIIKYKLLRLPKIILGNKRYELLRERILGS